MILNWPVITWIAWNGLTLMSSIAKRKEGEVSTLGFTVALGAMILTTALLHARILSGFLLFETVLWLFITFISVILAAVSPPNTPNSSGSLIVSGTVRMAVAVGVWLWMQ